MLAMSISATDLSAEMSVQNHSNFDPAATSPAAKLGWILIQKRWISAPQLQMLLAQQPCAKKLGELLLEQSLISEEQLDIALKEQYWRRNGYWVI